MGRLRARDRSDLAAKRCFDRGKSSREKYDTDGAGKGARETSIRSGKRSHKRVKQTLKIFVILSFLRPFVQLVRSSQSLARKYADVIETSLKRIRQRRRRQRQSRGGRTDRRSQCTLSLSPPQKNAIHSSTGFSSEIGTKLRDWAVGHSEGRSYSWAAVSSNDSKTR